MSESEHGSAHGRFQLLHNEHLEYLLAAKARCQHLWVGITAPELKRARGLRNSGRETSMNNPLSYFERVRMIAAVLIDAGVTREDFTIVPFPIEEPSSLPNYLHLAIPCFTTICEAWNHEKISTLSGVGYRVEVLFERAKKGISGRSVRESILRGEREWREWVPAATVRTVEDLRLKERLSALAASDEKASSDV